VRIIGLTSKSATFYSNAVRVDPLKPAVV
jgi:hypothetical protein